MLKNVVQRRIYDIGFFFKPLGVIFYVVYIGVKVNVYEIDMVHIYRSLMRHPAVCRDLAQKLIKIEIFCRHTLKRRSKILR